MTRQNAIHRYVRESEQDIKKLLRTCRGKSKPHHHIRKWWKAWHKRWKSNYLKEKEGIE